MHTVTLRLPEDMWEAIRGLATQERRSVNNQVVKMIEEWMADEHIMFTPTVVPPEHTEGEGP